MFIYDLDNEYGGIILGDADSTAPTLSINSNAAGQPAIAALSTASGSVVKVTAISGPGIDADSVSTTQAAGDFRSAASIGPALIVGRTVAGASTIGALQFLGTSVASGAIMNFAGGFISCTSVILTSVANFDYAIPVQVGVEMRYIPVVKGAGIIGGAAF